RNIPHQHFGPVIIARVGARRNPERVAGKERSVLAVDVRIIFCGHVTPAAPGFVADTPVFHIPGFLPAVFNTPLSHGASFVDIHVLLPVDEFLYCSASDIGSQVRLGTKQLAHVKKIVRAEAVVFCHATPPAVDHGWSLVFRTHAVLPMIGICKASSRPAQVGNLELFERLYHIVAHALGMRDGAVVFTYIKSAIDTAAKVLSKVAVDVTAYGRLTFRGADNDLVLRLGY